MSKDDIGFPGDVDSTELGKMRMRICKRCPLFKRKYYLIDICNDRLYLNPETNDVSTSPKDGYIRGCGCSLEYRVINPELHCVCKKW